MRSWSWAALPAGAAALLFAAGMAMAQHHSGHAPGRSAPSDTRVLVAFPPNLAAHTLASMRDHLHALQEISEALSLARYDAAGKIAEERLGMSSLRLHGAHEVASHMPKGMQDAGTAMHRAASRFAISAQNVFVTGDPKPALADLSEVMGACVGCHAGYRLR
ncbi:MAG: hypothetical protein AB7O57_02395 [Hyphomicrobiaceae bacterium]